MKSMLTKTKTICAFLLGIFLSTGIVMAQAPANDQCQDAQSLTLGTTVQGSTVGSTIDNVSYCQASVTGPAVWYKIEGNGGTIKLSTCGTASFDTKISIYSGTCGSLYCVAGNDDSPNCTYFTSEVDFWSQSGDTYYVMVHGFANTTGSFSLTASSATTSAANGTCGTAIGLTAGTSQVGTSEGGQISGAPTVNGVTATSPGVWYSFTGNGGPAILETCGSHTNFDTRLSIYTGDCGSLVGVAANDDYCALASKVQMNTTVAGQTYYVLVHGFGTQTGSFDLRLQQPQPPANDKPCGAIAIDYNTPTPFNNLNALADPNEITPGPGSDPNTCRQNDGWCFFEAEVQNSVWFTFVAPSSGCINLLAEGFDVQAGLYKATDCNDYATFSEVAGNDDSGNMLNPSLPASGPAALVEIACLDPGATYYLQIDGFNGASGNGTLTLTDCGNSPLSIDMGGCQSIFTGYAGTAGDTAYLNATPSGGFPPYSMEWEMAPGVLYTNPEYNGMAVKPTTTTSYTCTVTDSKGCSVSQSITVNVENVNTCYYAPAAGAYRTQTQGGWGTRANGNNPGVYRDANFASVFPNGLTVGCNNTITLTSSRAVQDFLPAGGPPAALTASYTDPTGNGRNGLRNVLAGQVVTLGLSLGFDQKDPSFGTGETWLGDLVIASGTFQDMKVSELFDFAEKALGGCSVPYGLSELNNAVTAVNENFVDGTAAGSFLKAPGVGMCNGTTEACVKPEEVQAWISNGYNMGSCTNTCHDANPAFPPPPPCETLILTVTGDVFSDFENSWTLIDLNTGEVIDSRDNGAVIPLVTEVNSYCLDPTHCYEFVMFDQFGDGFFFGGSYSIDFLGQNITSSFQDPFFNPLPSETQNVGSCSSAKMALQEQVDMIAFPNPFSEAATIEFSVKETCKARLEVFSLTGQSVAVLFDGRAEANQRYSNQLSGVGLMSGLYFYKLTTDKGMVKEGKIVLQK